MIASGTRMDGRRIVSRRLVGSAEAEAGSVGVGDAIVVDDDDGGEEKLEIKVDAEEPRGVVVDDDERMEEEGEVRVPSARVDETAPVTATEDESDAAAVVDVSDAVGAAEAAS
jgi:hypothetical protein